jgi:hypothetical protein
LHGACCEGGGGAAQLGLNALKIEENGDFIK